MMDDFSDSFVSTASISSKSPVITLMEFQSFLHPAENWIYGLVHPKNQLSHVRDGVERLLRSRLCAFSSTIWLFSRNTRSKETSDNILGSLGLDYP